MLLFGLKSLNGILNTTDKNSNKMPIFSRILIVCFLLEIWNKKNF